MQTITTIGFDIAKSIFQVHCVDAEGKVILRRQTQAALRAGLLPKATAVLGWHRSLRFGASLVARTPGARPRRSPDAAGLCEALCERHKNDATDAEAICEAVTRPIRAHLAESRSHLS